jgi:hypothetical protein
MQPPSVSPIVCSVALSLAAVSVGAGQVCRSFNDYPALNLLVQRHYRGESAHVLLSNRMNSKTVSW